MTDIENLTLKQIREIASLTSSAATRDDSAWEIGKIYLIRTVTMIDTGRLVAVGGGWLGDGRTRRVGGIVHPRDGS